MKGQRSDKAAGLLKLDRRTLLVGGGVGIGLVLAWGTWRWAEPDAKGLEPSFGPYLKVGTDGRVIVAVPQTETGQGIWTALPQLVADELGARWDMVAVEPAPFNGIFANRFADEEGWFAGLGRVKKFRLDGAAARITARSTSVRAFEQPMREAGAAARAMLIAAAASRWNVDAADCDTIDSMVVYGGKKLGFGELAADAASQSPPELPPLRQRRRPLAGKPVQRLDLPAKVSGAFRFAGDVRLPGMLFASVRMAPLRGSVTGHKKVDGVFAGEGWVAAVGETWWAAEQRLKQADPRFQAPRTPLSIDAMFDDALAAGEAETLLNRGDYAGAVEGSRALTAIYRVAPALHLGLEPLSATARIADGRLEVWAASQAPELARGLVNDVSGEAEGGFYPMPAGDGGGRAIEPGPIAVAAELARRLRRPVHASLSAATSQNHERPSPGALARMYGLPGAGGLTAAWKMRLVTAAGLESSLARLVEGGVAGGAQLQGLDLPYNIPNVRIDGVTTTLPFAPGYMRGSPERELTFFTESFADELARAAGLDPLTFRIGLLGSNPRLANCLQRATRSAGWDGGGAGSTMGLAAASAYGSHIALVAEATVGADQSIEVHRLVASVDCGRAINPGIVEQQLAGGMIWAIGQASVAAPSWVGGMPLSRTWGQVAVPRIGRIPDIRIDLVPSSADPGGVSGLGVAVVAPAIANALHAATGKRLRNLPFDLMEAA